MKQPRFGKGIMDQDPDKQIELEATVHYEDGMYWANVAEYPGLFASGETVDELIEALTEAWALYAHDRSRDGAAARGIEPPTETRRLGLLVPAHA